MMLSFLETAPGCLLCFVSGRPDVDPAAGWSETKRQQRRQQLDNPTSIASPDSQWSSFLRRFEKG